MKINKIIIISALFLNYLKAQILTPEIAVETAIKNNINIIISRNNAEIANIAYSRGNAGMLPNLQLNGGGTISQNDTRQNLLNGTVVDRKGANSSLINSSLSLNWTLFDGKKMFFTYKKLGSEKNLAEKEIKKDIEELTANILNKYYTLVKTKLLIKSFDTLMNLYKTRLETAEYKWKNGSSSKLNFLQAQTDMNEQESELIKYKNEEEALKIELNGLLSRAPDIKFEVIDSIPVNNFLTFEEINSAISKNNIQLQIQKENSLIANYKLKEINSLFYPKLNLSSGYNFNRNENQAGFILLNRNLGFVGGVTASWNLFNGGINKRLSKTAKIEIENADLILNYMKLGIDGEILTAIVKKRNFSKILEIEEKNLIIAKEGAQIALEAFRYGSINYVELKEAHRNYENIIQKAVNTKLELKRCEIEIMRLTGKLVK